MIFQTSQRFIQRTGELIQYNPHYENIPLHLVNMKV